MATLVLQTVGAIAGEFLGGPIGAAIGQTIGAVAGNAIDQRLFGPQARDTSGPRLTSLAGLASTEGAALPRVHGRARIGGQMIWATRFLESTSSSGGGKGGAGGGGVQTSYYYSANFAIGLCEGPVAEVRRIWADGKEIDRTLYNIRVYPGDEAQEADPLIVAKEGAQNAPAYRGLAYVVFEAMALGDFGNRVPQLSFEVVRPPPGLPGMLRAVDVIPGAGEFAYDPGARVQPGQTFTPTSAENRHTLVAESDWLASMDSLQAVCPNVSSAALVVTWFGDDLRAGQCKIQPRVERWLKSVSGPQWSVASRLRSQAPEASKVDGKPAYGGTPSDASVIAAIADMKARGLSVVLYPFVMMDVPADSGRPDPWTGAASQPAYPWRGRIVCDPAPGRPDSVDGSAIAGAQVASFFGSANPAGEEWSYRRFILHYARLCAAAGGVDAFLIGSELVSLTRVRSAPGVYPAASALATLAADVKAILGASTKVSYAADWTEYGAHVLDGGAEVRFPLDDVWASPAVDFIGVDMWAPLSDWRDGVGHLDAVEAPSIYDRDYLRGRVGAGEAYDWYYANAAASSAQSRTPIVDGAYGKPWTFRQKDLVGWWSNAHKPRIGGIEAAATNWTPRAKPIWLTEIGCPAVDRGANAPNVFPDPKSSESALPPFSRGFRDDLMQTRALEAILSRFDPALEGFVEAYNPVSPVYGGRMVDPARIFAWAWDARPFPAFPTQAQAWSDAPQWQTGHWLNGRIEGAPLDRLLAAICGDDIQPLAGVQVDGFLDGYVIERPMSPRAALEPLASFYAFDPVVSGGAVRFQSRRARAPVVLGDNDLAPREGGELVTLTRGQESELPQRLAVTFWDGETDYRTATVQSRRLEAGSRREKATDLALVTTRAEAQRRCEIWLQDIWSGRETASFDLPPGRLALEVGDVAQLVCSGVPRQFRIERIVDGARREIEARAVQPSIYDHPPAITAGRAVAVLRTQGPPLVRVLDIALVREQPVGLQHIAVHADPWPRSMALWRAEGAGFVFAGLVEQPAAMGETLSPLGPGVTSRFDGANTLTVRMARGELSSVEAVQALAGRTLMAVQGEDGQWEAFSFTYAEPVATRTWRLSRLIRGLGGQDDLAARTVPAGAPVVLIDAAVMRLTADPQLIGAPQTYRVGPAQQGHGGPAVTEFVAAARDLSLRPYAPVRTSARRLGGGVEITFTRRGRIDADPWSLVDAPLGEMSEGYEIEVLAGAVLKRVLTSQQTRLVYASADELTDFGAPQTSLRLRIFQMSAAVGRGFARDVTIQVR